MTTPPPVYTAMTRDEVVSELGQFWPVAPDGQHLILPPDAGITDGAVAVYPKPNRPGFTWWALDGAIPVQAMGVPDEALAALLPGSELVLAPPPPPDDTPPPSPPSGY